VGENIFGVFSHLAYFHLTKAKNYWKIGYIGNFREISGNFFWREDFMGWCDKEDVKKLDPEKTDEEAQKISDEFHAGKFDDFKAFVAKHKDYPNWMQTRD
jgi:hypothetical protein